MAIQDTLKAKGRVGIVLRDKDGNVKEERTEQNLVVTTGLAYIASRMVDNADPLMDHLAIGGESGTPTAAAAGQTALQGTERDRNAATISHSGSDFTATATFSAGEGTGLINEAGLFDQTSGGNMLCRVSFGDVNKEALDSMTVSWTISLSAS